MEKDKVIIFRTMEEAVDYFHSLDDKDLPESSDDEFDICQLPPGDNDRVTDTEDIDENNLDSVLPSDVCSEVAVFVKSRTTDSSEDVSLEAPSTSEECPPQRKKGKTLPKSTEKTNKKGKSVKNWKTNSKFTKNIPTESPDKISDKFPELVTMEPIDLFHEYITKEYIDHLANMTNTYGAQHGSNFRVEWSDIAQFFGLLLLSGYHCMPNEDSYWSTAEDMEVRIVPSVMPRSKFREIKANFHLVDNYTISLGDKLAKIQPIYDELCKNFMKFGIFHDTLSIDESMVPYYGHHSCKMFIRGKPIRFGYKIWIICSPNGYPYNMEIYKGKSDNKSPLGSRVVHNLLSVVPNPVQVEVYFDNFFTSYELLEDLQKRNTKATGTVRENRIAKCPLTPVKQMGKTKRGTFDYLCDGTVYVCRWNDNSVVTIASNHDTHLPMKYAKRYSKEKKEKVNIEQPNLIAKYNNGMGGVDLLDRLLGSYRPKLRSKKWWWNLFSNALNMAVVAAWIAHKELHPNPSPLQMDHLSFRREVTMALLKIRPRRDVPRPGPKAKIPLTQRKSDGHYLKSATQGRCVHCSKNTKYECHECNKRIHIECFPYYHGLK